MPKVAVLDMAGKEVSSMELSDAIFGIKPNRIGYAPDGGKLSR